MSRAFVLSVMVLAGAVLHASPGTATAGSGEHRHGLSEAARRGQDFALARCADCHAVSPGRTSPNPEAPSFSDIANRPGVTAATLEEYLRDSHNYPEAMDFRVEPSQLGDLADYIQSLQKPGYRPDI